MAKKLILLLLIIPIVVMILLFAATQSLSNLVDVPVTGIEIIGKDEFVYLDVDKEESYTLEYAVYPTTAKNKSVSVSTEAFGNEPLAEFEFITADGKVTVVPTTAGAARIVLTTVSGGFRDSIIVYSTSTKLQAIEATISKSELYVGEAASISTTFLPENPGNTLLEYVSSDPNVVQVNSNGVVLARNKGTATITVISEFDKSITDTITVTVSNKDEMDLGVSEGGLVSFGATGKIPISIKSDEEIVLENLSYKILDENGAEVPESVVKAEFNINGATVTLDYQFQDVKFVGTVTVEITFTNGDVVVTKSCAVSKMREFELSFNESKFYTYSETATSIPHILTPEDAEVTYTVSADNDNLTASINNNGNVVINTLKAGTTVITLTAKNEEYGIEKTATITVVIRPRNFTINEAAREYGVEKIFTIGGYEFDATGNLIPSSTGSKAFKLSFKTSSKIGAGFAENIVWASSSDKVLIDKNGVISFVDDTFEGEVSFYASFSYEGIEEKTAAYTIRCVANGINVYSFADLYKATKATDHQIVLHTNVKEDFGVINGEAVYEKAENPYYTVIDTTYDKIYYRNDPEAGEAKVKILLEFKNNLYGNGYIINAHNVTYSIIDKKFDSNGDVIERIYDENALFKGPLNFVMMREDDGATTSVKAQDNICFAIYENVTIRNVELRGCDLEGDENGSQDLVDLDYVGTTVEVLGDNVTIAYSRLTNGRTVLRAFGDIDDSTKKIHLDITNSVLSGAREFIMRIGSNRFVDPIGDDYSPNLPGDRGDEYNSKRDYYLFSDAEKAAYDETFINTFVTVKNSVFKDTGIFAIGMDSHFAGEALHNGRGNPRLEKYLGKWYDLAKTSYGAKLYFEGDVELYNWKDMEDIDSSTLIEVKGTSAFDMKLDLQLMIETAKAKNPEKFQNISTNYNGKDYVHAGIAFFGGGKNYSVFDSEKNITLGRYDVSLEEVDLDILELAAGTESFYFFLYDNTTKVFTPQMQQEKLADKSAYDCIYK